jgi:hypothetical protein
VLAERMVVTLFCDDIRNELGNKVSLMGCYLSSLQVQSFPTTLPKLCAQVRVLSPLERPFGKFTVRVMRGDTALGEMQFPAQAIASKPFPEGAQGHQAVAYIVMAPFVIESPCSIRVEVETEEETLRGGYLWISGIEPSNVVNANKS